DSLRGRDDVRHVAIALGAEVVAEPAPGADHLDGVQKDAIAVTDLADSLEVAVLRWNAAAGVLNGLEDHGGHRLGRRGHAALLDRVRCPQWVAVCRPAVGVGVWNMAA